MDIPIRLAAFAALIAAAAFFSASEFAIVKVRSSRIDQLLSEGNKRAFAAKQVLSNLDDYLSVCQLGIAVSVLGLGWLGQSMVTSLLAPLISRLDLSAGAAQFLSFLIAFGAATLLVMVAGELTPKTAAVQKAEGITLFNAPILIWLYRLMYPVIRLINGLTGLVAKLFGIQPVSRSEIGHTEEDLKLLLSDSLKSGEINTSEYTYVNKIFDFDDRVAKEVMVPRTEMITVDKDMSMQQVVDLVGIEQFTRYPVADGDKDHIIGLVNMKHLLTAYLKNPSHRHRPVEQYMQPVIQVIDTIPISELLLKIQRERIHMAILMDEYGGTSGLITIEDIIEEIVGDIRDEFDTDELPEFQVIGEDHYILDAKMLIEHVNDRLGTDITEEDIDTIGGWFMAKSFDAIKGDRVEEQGYEFLIKDIDGHHIQYLEVKKLQESIQPMAEAQ